jgi:HD-GYP domain-containing protein (c-di-GMP phosphodiesterase class II)
VDAKIIVKHGKSKGKTYPLGDGQRVTIGRGLKADIQVFDEGLSRLHCAIENCGNSFEITDLESANGSYLNGKAVKTVNAFSGDELTLGLAVFELEGPPRPGGAGMTQVLPLAGGKPKSDRPPGRKGTEILRKVDPGQEHMLNAEDNVTHEQLLRAHRDLVTIYRVANAINAHQDPRELADTLAQMVIEFTDADHASVLLKDRRDGTIESVASRQAGIDVPVIGITFSRTVVSEVVRKGVSVLSANVPEDERYAPGDSVVMQRVQSLMCVPLLAQGEVIGALYVDSSSGPGAFDERDLELLVAIGNQAGVALQRVGLLAELENLFFSSIRTLVAVVDRKDGYTHGHSERVTAFALKLAREMELPEREIEVIPLAGLLHDLGKIGVPEKVLNKPGELTDEEFEQMKLHPIHGAEIISTIESPYVDEIVPAVRHHHEWWNGQGYPDGLVGEETPRLARLLAITDAFDAMTSDRPYHKGSSMDRAIQIVRDCSGTQFDPEFAKGLVRLHERGELVLPKTMALKYTTTATPKVP